MRRRGVAMSVGVGVWSGWGRRNVDTVGAADEVSQLSCVVDERHLAFSSGLALSQWLSWGVEAFPAEAVEPRGRRQ